MFLRVERRMARSYTLSDAVALVAAVATRMIKLPKRNTTPPRFAIPSNRNSFTLSRPIIIHLINIF